MKPLILERKDILGLLDKNEIMDAVEKSFIEFSSGKVRERCNSLGFVLFSQNQNIKIQWKQYIMLIQ